MDYQFVHLNVLREYLEMEFLGDVLPLPQSQARGDALEQVLDDLAFITMLVGSDFLPRIPCLYLKEGALDVMFEKYRQLRESGEVAHLVLGPRICAPDMRVRTSVGGGWWSMGGGIPSCIIPAREHIVFTRCGRLTVK